MADAGWLAALPEDLARIVAALAEPAAAALAALAGAVGGIALMRRLERRETGDETLELIADPIFALRGGALQPLNRAARDFAAANLPAPTLAALSGWLARQDGELDGRLEELLARAEPFRIEITTAEGRHLELDGRPRGALTVLTLREATGARAREAAAMAALARVETEHRLLTAIVDAAPVPMWRSLPGKGVVWANAAYRRLAGAHDPEARPPALFAQPGTPARTGAADAPRRLSLPGQGGDPLWFEVTERDLGDAGIGGVAVGIDAAVRAEAALRRFVETLTETFAHLPIGLAVFDKNRRLGLFNPAIADILKLDPAWLASRPTLRQFLERLRENRQMPDPPDFLAWRSRLTALERDAEAAAYEEDWVLPSGQTLHVSGRPHTQGAIALLFEDISSAITLERRYRAEIETLKAVLNKLPDAVALFRPDGMLAHANTAFHGVWRLDPAQMQPPPHISRLIEHWAAACEPGPVWRRLHDFATGQDARAPWCARLLLRDGRIMQARFAPLPDGSTLTSFQDETERERLQADLRDAVADLATERRLMLDRLEALRGALGGGAADAPDAAALAKDLGRILARLREGAAEGAEEALSGSDLPGLPATELPALVQAVADLSRGEGTAGPEIRIDVAGELPGLSRRRLRQLLHGLIAAAEAQAPGRLDSLSVRRQDDALVMAAHLAGAGAEPAPGLAVALLRRLARLEGGNVVIEADAAGDGAAIRCTIPLRAAGSGPRAALSGGGK